MGGHPFCSQVIIAILFLGPRTHVLRVERAVEEIWAGLQVWGGCLSTLQCFIISYTAIRTRNLNSFKMLTVVKYAYCVFKLVSLLIYWTFPMTYLLYCCHVQGHGVHVKQHHDWQRYQVIHLLPAHGNYQMQNKIIVILWLTIFIP